MRLLQAGNENLREIFGTRSLRSSILFCMEISVFGRKCAGCRVNGKAQYTKKSSKSLFEKVPVQKDTK